MEVHPLDPADAPITAAIRAMSSAGKGVPPGIEARGQYTALMQSVLPRDDVTFEADAIGGIEGLWALPRGGRTEEAILYLHGGWFTLGSADAYRNLVGHIAARAGARAFIPNYRLAPEHVFPAATDDALASYNGLAKKNVRRVALTGDSAGGNLALGLASRIAGGEIAAGAALIGVAVISPVTDLTLSSSTYNTRADADPFFTRPQVAEIVRSYLGNAEGGTLLGLTVEQEKAQAARPGSDFKECANGCPVMIVIPSGKFIMGSPENELDRNASESPRHEVTITKPFPVSKFEVTFEEWDACVAAAACPRVPDVWGRERMPAINVSWVDPKQYVGWLSQLTGKEYRLLTEAEWEYAARAGANTRYSWGDDLGMGNANCDGCGSQWDLQQTAPLDRLSRMGWGSATCMAMSGSGLRIAGTRTTTLRQLTDQRGSRTVTLASGSSAAAPGATRVNLSVRPSASGAMPRSGSTRLASG